MAQRIQLLGHTTAIAETFTGLPRELTVDEGRNSLRLHNGSVAGGFELARADLRNVINGERIYELLDVIDDIISGGRRREGGIHKKGSLITFKYNSLIQVHSHLTLLDL